MAFEWDPNKEDVNLAKHGISFVAAVRIFDGICFEWRDTKKSYGEERLISVGSVGGVFMTVISTWREDVRRIISARRSNEKEKRKYRTL